MGEFQGSTYACRKGYAEIIDEASNEDVDFDLLARIDILSC